MILQMGLGLISIGWIVQIIKMKKNELNKYALLCYMIGAALLAYSGFSDGIIADTDILESLTLLTSGIVFYKLWAQGKKK
ncbi:MAG: hypothetical protein WC393_03545 [Candidatus Nanoarchaeia archaeon]|jgi:hypothetical protein